MKRVKWLLRQSKKFAIVILAMAIFYFWLKVPEETLEGVEDNHASQQSK